MGHRKTASCFGLKICHSVFQFTFHKGNRKNTQASVKKTLKQTEVNWGMHHNFLTDERRKMGSVCCSGARRCLPQCKCCIMEEYLSNALYSGTPLSRTPAMTNTHYVELYPVPPGFAFRFQPFTTYYLLLSSDNCDANEESSPKLKSFPCSSSELLTFFCKNSLKYSSCSTEVQHVFFFTIKNVLCTECIKGSTYKADLGSTS